MSKITPHSTASRSSQQLQRSFVTNIRPPGSLPIETAVKKFGPAPGARKLMDREQNAAEWSLQTGVYGVWRCAPAVRDHFAHATSGPSSDDIHFLDFCSRIGPDCLCFCGHLFADHDQHPTSRKPSTKCHLCDCSEYYFVPSRPEGIIQYFQTITCSLL